MSGSVVVQIRTELVSGVARYERKRRRRASIVAIAALLVVIVGGGGLVWSARHDRKSQVLVGPTGPIPDSPLPRGPLPGLHRIPAPPGGARLPTRPVWTGHDFLSVGAIDDRGTLAAVSFDVAKRQWRQLALPPVAIGEGAATAWTGKELVICCSGATESGAAAAYDPASDTWRVLPDAPVHGYTSAVSTGDRVIVVAADGVASFDPATDQWRSLPAPPHLESFNKVAWTGHDLIVWPAPGSRSTWSGEMFDPDSGAWTVLPDPPQRSWPAIPDIAWMDGTLAVLGGLPAPGPGSERFVASRYDPASRTWVSLPEPLPEPAGCECNLGSQESLWTGRDLLVYNAYLASGVSADGVLSAYDPARNSWRFVGSTSETALRPLAMAGDRALLEQNGNYYLSDPQWRPAEASPPAPARLSWNVVGLDAGVPDHAAIAVTESDLVVWGGVDSNGGFLDHGRRYDLRTGAGSALPPAPLARRQDARAIGTSSGAVVLGGYGDNGRRFVDAALFDPAHNEWSRLPSLAPGVSVQDVYAHGDDVYVAGKTGSSSDAPGGLWHLNVAADDAWNAVPLPRGASNQLAIAGFEGGGLILAATEPISLEPGRQRLGRTAFYTTDGDGSTLRWRARGSTPGGIVARDVLVADGRLVVVWDGDAQQVPDAEPVAKARELLYRDLDARNWQEVTLPLPEVDCSSAIDRIAGVYVVWSCGMVTLVSSDLTTWRHLGPPSGVGGLLDAPAFGAQRYFVARDSRGASSVARLVGQ